MDRSDSSNSSQHRHRRRRGRPEASRSRDRAHAEADAPDYDADDAPEHNPASAPGTLDAIPVLRLLTFEKLPFGSMGLSFEAKEPVFFAVF